MGQGKGCIYGHPKQPKLSKSIKMEERIMAELALIKSYTMLAAKTVLTIDDVHLLTGISKSTIYRLTCEKKIPYYKPNAKLLFFDRAEIEAWAKQNRVNTKLEAEQAALAHCLGVTKGGTR